jgi:rare lipoprotein A
MRCRKKDSQGKKTASGQLYDKNGLTAAHKKLPYRTKVKVTNVENG